MKTLMIHMKVESPGDLQKLCVCYRNTQLSEERRIVGECFHFRLIYVKHGPETATMSECVVYNVDIKNEGDLLRQDLV